MVRSKFVRFAAFAGLGITFVFVVSSACTQPPRACLNQSAGYLPSGPWILQTVDGTPLGSAGYPIPTTQDRLVSGYLQFKTAACTGPGVSKGTVVAHYVTKAPGAAAKFKNYAGSFKFDENNNNTLTLKAFGYSADGPVTAGKTIYTIGADLSLLGAGTKTLVFKN